MAKDNVSRGTFKPAKGGPKGYVSRCRELINALGLEMTAAMRAKKMKLYELEAISGISSVTISKVLKGDLDNVSLETLDKIAYSLGIEIEPLKTQ